MNDVLRIARLKIALQRAFLGRAILIFTLIFIPGVTIIGSDSERETVQNCLHKILVDDLSNLPCSMRTALSMLTLLIPVCSDIPGKSVKRSVRVYKLACLDIHICKFSSRKCSFIVKGENPFNGENIWGLLQKHPHLHNIWVPLHEVIQLSY